MTTSTKHAPAHSASESADDSKQDSIVVDIGKGSRKDVRKLRKGRPGKLMRRVDETIEHLRESGAIAPDAQPIIIVIRQKTRSRANKLFGLG